MAFFKKIVAMVEDTMGEEKPVEKKKGGPPGGEGGKGRGIEQALSKAYNTGLSHANFDLRIVCHYGVPASPCCIAVEPLQSLMAVGSRDGIVKVWRKEGKGGGGFMGELKSN